jgi:hypothetical protein
VEDERKDEEERVRRGGEREMERVVSAGGWGGEKEKLGNGGGFKLDFRV